MTFPFSRKLRSVKAVCDYYTLDRSQIQRIVGVANDRVMRAILLECVQAGLLNKTRMQAVSPASGGPAPVYFPTRRGAELVAAEFDDERYLHVCTNTPDWTHLLHWLAVAEFHIRLDQAVAMLPSVELLGWFGEWDEVNPFAQSPQERYRIYTLISEKPRLVCVPDFAFAVRVGGTHSKMYYGEMDRGSSSLQQIVRSKFPGFAALAAHRLHRRIFETTTDLFTVLHISPTPARRDHLRKVAAKQPGADLHRFAAFTDWTSEQALTDAIFFASDQDDPQPLVRVSQGVPK